MKIKIEEIKVNPGRRAVSQDGIEELAFSIEQIGLLHPITLTEDYTLVAGLHRLEAAKSLGWSEIECTITDLDALTAQLAELDENFARTNLSHRWSLATCSNGARKSTKTCIPKQRRALRRLLAGARPEASLWIAICNRRNRSSRTPPI